MNIVIYARYSYSGQREESIEGQLKACNEYASEHKYTVLKEYVDRGKSATNDRREQFQQMLLDSKSGDFQAVLVYQLDRFARNRYDSAINKKKLKDNGVAVLSAKENISDSPEGKMLEGVLEALAEYQSADMAQKINRGLHINAEKCVFNGGPVPIGYYIDDEKHFQIDEERAAIVKKVFQDYADDKPIVDIVDELKVAGVKNWRGNDFTGNSFRTMLQNKRYTGHFIYADVDVPGGIPRIISDELFERVQGKIKKNKRLPSSRDRYLLTTKLFCGECDSLMTGHSGTSHTGAVHSYYGCTEHRKHKCDLPNIRKEVLEDLIVKECRNRLTDDAIKMISVEVAKLSEEEYNSPIVEGIKRNIKECDTAISNLMKALEKGMEADLILERLQMKRDEQKQLQERLDKETLGHHILTNTEIEFFLRDLREGSINDFKYRQMLINTMVNRVYVYHDRILC